ncbi:dihydropteroate synthase [Peptoclostridium litorale DSM 5388]|uniref:Dihydropteroate synthase n=1 Tax=Peptoclostridium litorale DSM 5388 TaxID=1121324 RepID=A0A069RCA5_PEPLI|nr:dihydropteroate synthase [Peptoclostridium litorale]KDR94418.1 dihydropteroate synthase [Peptoclostridium litorale DSM 5388]SIO24225.1 dihydropteroate synthase [Peptoclostridium litorale DSM 5388]
MFEFSKKTYIMGILNVTPDSFSDGGRYNEAESAIKRAIEMQNQGADIIDVGGESTRPGHTPVSEHDEIIRISKVVRSLRENIDIPVSIDTYKSNVAACALKLGASIINDIWGLQKDPEMARIVAQNDAYVVAMHNQDGTEYEADIMEEIKSFLKKSVEIAINAGVDKDKIILDPGIGFGKTPEQNIEVMARLEELKSLGYPILLGASRKSMIGKILDLPSNERVEGTVATTVIGIEKGVDIVRVHDVKENYRAAKVADAILRRRGI